jgi:hypothetical protein
LAILLPRRREPANDQRVIDVNSMPTISHLTAKPDIAADYESMGAQILADTAVAEMRKSVARLRQELRSAFPPENAAPASPGASQQG